ncbi:protein NO VEIN domain-containing protein [Paenibacillus sp. SEL1]
MLRELKKHNNLGSLEEILYVLTEAISKNPKRITDIEKFCLNSTLFYNIPNKGILSLLQFISAVSTCDSGLYLSKVGEELLSSEIEGTIGEKIAKKVLSKILTNDEFSDFLDLDSIYFDYLHEAYIIKNNHIPFKYSGVRNLLIELGFFSSSSQVKNLLVIHVGYNDFLKGILRPVRKKISIKKFKEMQVLKEKYGREAEEFVLNYERNRISEHAQASKISQISDIDVSAGYDIISFNSLTSLVFDRFIEVKSYSKNLSFYWTNNEINVSRNKGSNYYLYLINREQMNEDGYEPYIIANPFETVYKNDIWKREPQTWLFYTLPELK